MTSFVQSILREIFLYNLNKSLTSYALNELDLYNSGKTLKTTITVFSKQLFHTGKIDISYDSDVTYNQNQSLLEINLNPEKQIVSVVLCLVLIFSVVGIYIKPADHFNLKMK